MLERIRQGMSFSEALLAAGKRVYVYHTWYNVVDAAFLSPSHRVANCTYFPGLPVYFDLFVPHPNQHFPGNVPIGRTWLNSSFKSNDRILLHNATSYNNLPIREPVGKLNVKNALVAGFLPHTSHNADIALTPHAFQECHLVVRERTEKGKEGEKRKAKVCNPTISLSNFQAFWEFFRGYMLRYTGWAKKRGHSVLQKYCSDLHDFFAEIKVV